MRRSIPIGVKMIRFLMRILPLSLVITIKNESTKALEDRNCW